MARRSADTSTGEDRLRVIAERVRTLDAVFSCGGSVKLEEPIVLRFRGGYAIEAQHAEGWRRTDVGKALMKRCTPAPFGVGRETRHDERVRKGGQLLAAGGALRVEGLDLARTGILDEIRRALLPGDASPPEAELYALNVYLRGGHFVGHKDTPRDRDVLGTLVVCLPIRFEGGRLVLRHEATRVYDWESDRYGVSRRSPAEQKSAIHWAAFYGDVDHEVEPVTSGARVTLTWLLRRTATGELAARDPGIAETELSNALFDALGDRRFLPKGGTLGIPCLHLYAEAPGLARPAASLSEATATRMKGRDRQLALVARRVGLDVRYRPYLYDDGGSGSWRLSRDPSARERAIFDDDRLGGYDLEHTMPIEHAASWPHRDDVTWILPPPWERSWREPSTDAEPATKLLAKLEYSATDYFGNEGSDGAFYVAGALLLDIPPASERWLDDEQAAAAPRRKRRR